MTLIRRKRGIPCDCCDKVVKYGDVLYSREEFYYCEDCYDRVMADVKKDAKVTVNNDNFDMEDET